MTGIQRLSGCENSTFTGIHRFESCRRSHLHRPVAWPSVFLLYLIHTNPLGHIFQTRLYPRVCRIVLNTSLCDMAERLGARTMTQESYP
jgi:hypothetical protein